MDNRCMEMLEKCCGIKSTEKLIQQHNLYVAGVSRKWFQNPDFGYQLLNRMVNYYNTTDKNPNKSIVKEMAEQVIKGLQYKENAISKLDNLGVNDSYYTENLVYYFQNMLMVIKI